MAGPEGPKKGIERPPLPKAGTWWEYIQGDSEPRVVIGVKVHEGEKLVKLVSKHMLRQSARIPENALVQSESVPLKEFEARLKRVSKAPKGVAKELVDEVIAAFSATQEASPQAGAGEDKVELTDERPSVTISPGQPPVPVPEAEPARDWHRPEFRPEELTTVTGLEVSDQFYIHNAGVFYEKDGKPAVPRIVVARYSERVGLTGRVDWRHVDRIMEGSIGVGELMRAVPPDEILELYRHYGDPKEPGASAPAPDAERAQTQKPEQEGSMEAAHAEKLIAEAKDLNQLVAAIQEIGTFPGGSKIHTAQEMINVVIHAAQLDPVNPAEHPIISGVTRTYGLRDAVIRLLMDRKTASERPSEISPTAPVKGEPEPDALETPRPTPRVDDEALLTRGQEAADALRPERQAMLDAEQAYLEKYKEFVTNKKFREKEPPELISLRQAYSAARSAYAQSLQSMKYERLAVSQQYDDEEIRERIKARLDRVTDPDQREKLLAYYKDPGRYRVEVSMRYDRVVRYRELFSDHARKKIDARFDALDERKKGLFVKAASWVGNQNAKLEAWAGSKTKARVVRAVASTVLVGAVGGAVGAIGTMSALAFAGWGTWRIGRVLAASTLGSVAGTGVATTADSLMQWDTKRSSSRTRKEDAVGALNEGDLEAIAARQERFSSTMDSRVRQKRKQIIAALTGLGVGVEIATLAALVPGAETLADSQPDEQGSRDATPAENRQTLRESVNEVERTTQTNTSTATEQAGSSRPSQPAPTEQSRATTTAPEETPAGGQTPEATDGVAVIERGEGANSMFYELQRELETRYPDPANRPVAVTRLLGESSAEGWSQALGFFRVENGEVISRIMHEGDTLTVNDNGELVFHDAFANNGQGANYRLMDSRGQFNGDAIRQVEQGIPQPEPVAAPATPVTLEAEESVRPVPEVSPPEAASTPTPAVPDATPMQTPTETQSAPPVPSSGPIPTLDQWVAEQQGAGVQSGEMPIAPDTAPQAPITEPVPAPVTEPVVNSQGNDAIPSLDQYVQENAPAASTPAAEPAPTTWQPGMAMPAEPSAFKLQGTGNEVFVHNTGAPAQNLQLAQEYARTHPGVRVYFDNPQEKWFGLSLTPRVASIEYDQYGNLVRDEEQALDSQGRALASVTDRLERRIA